MLKLNSINKAFKHQTVLNDINLEIKEGELIHISGINGSCKTTLLKIISGLIKPEDGQLILDSSVKIGALIENPTFIENENMAFNLRFLYTLTHKYDESKVKDLTKLFLLDYISKTPIKKYSLGMRQKVGIIQAIMENQNLILLDEPTRGLDKESIKIFNKAIYKLIKERKSVIICAHDGIDNIEFSAEYEIKNGQLYKIN